MFINVSKLRSHYPEFCGIRKGLQTIKVKRIRRHIIPHDKILLCEADGTKKDSIIAPYLEKWKQYLQPCYDELKTMEQNAPIFHTEGIDAQKVKTDILFCRLAYGFIPSEYIGFDLYNKTVEERKTYCSDLDTNVFGYTVNNIAEVQTVLNKETSAKKYKNLFKRDFIIVGSKEDFQEFCNFVSKHPVFVKKKIFSSMGKGVELVNSKEVQIEKFFDQLIVDGRWLLEECVIQRPEMACFNATSVNTVRCITFRTHHGIEVPYCFMRTGRNGSFVDNGGSGGLLIGIDVETGLLDTDAFDEYGRVYVEHPDSGIQFRGYKIPEWGKMLNICRNAAEQDSQMGYLSWDMAYTNHGWCVIEVNEVGQLIVPQIVYKKGIKDELEQYLRTMPIFIWAELI